MHTQLFSDFDFSQLYSPDFKEDSVREVLILPILQGLGYAGRQIVRSKALANPFLKVGSQKRQIKQVPDYLLKTESESLNYAWVLDAKAPNENINSGENLEQIYSYAIHPEVRTKFFALCNGKEFILFRQDEEKPLLYFSLNQIDSYWEELQSYLAPTAFQSGKDFIYTTVKTVKSGVKDESDYINRPLLDEMPVQKQASKRHFGVHGYFTKQSWNVVRAYIEHFSNVGDLVLDPFGGSGVTAIEALMSDRKTIHIDLNPMSVFIVNALLAPVKINELIEAFERVKTAFIGLNTQSFENLTALNVFIDLNPHIDLKGISYPQGFRLPKGSDVQTIEQLFTEKQLAQLAVLKHLILKEKNANIKNSLLLAFSSSINKFNLTFHYTKTDGGGDSAIFRYYRYRIAPQPDELDLMNIFETKFKKILAAKKDVGTKIDAKTIKNGQIVKGTATDLDFVKNESVDYIYTDPPYGKKIPYLDLSIMWNAWLDLPVTEEDYEMEAIEGGEHHKSKDNYNELIAQSIKEMYRVLKFDRWMSFVFAHKDPEFWHLIIDTAEKCGFEYAGAVKQSNGQTSFKKRQNPFTVLSGQLIINFKKVRKPRYILKANLGMDISEIFMQTAEGIIAKHNGATLEQINDELIIKGLELGFLELLAKKYTDLTPVLMDMFDYEEKTQKFHIRKNKKFQTHIDLNLRIRYYLLSYLRRMEIENKISTFDDIVLNIMPLLKNGITPENQSILGVLETLAQRVGADGWRLNLQRFLF
jgi:16S rRNA G966 N2-methylase RsmD